MVRKRKDKRKKSSDTGSNKQKVAKHGGQSAASGDDSDDGQSCSELNTDILSVSQLLKSSNDILYNDSLNMSSGSVFEAEGTSGDNDGQNTTSKGSLSGGDAGTAKPKDPTNADILSYLMQMDTKFSSKISAIEARLEKLESLEAKVNSVDTELKKVWTFMQDGHKKVEERVREIEEKQDSVSFSVGMASDRVTQMEKERDELKSDIVYMQSQSMRNNLLVSGLQEAPNEIPGQTEQALRTFFVDKLNMAQDLVNSIAFERVHRMGPPSEGRSRTIVAKFTLYKDREIVRKLRSKLNNTSYYINEQFPKEVVEKRKALLPMLRAAKRDGKNAWLVYDKLYIDGKVVQDAE